MTVGGVYIKMLKRLRCNDENRIGNREVRS